jgi:pyruvate carboxylase
MRLTTVGAGTVEYLMDADTGAFYFIEVNPRIQVEHTVTEEVTGIDIVKAQIHILEGAKSSARRRSGVPAQENIRLNGHALQCRITTEDPEQNFIPDYGRITAYRGATGFGIRLDGGTAYSGAVITRFYDPLLEKVTAWAPTPEEAHHRMDRALREFRIRGVATNLTFLEAIIGHAEIPQQHLYDDASSTRRRNCSSRSKAPDRATKLLTYLADVTRSTGIRKPRAGRCHRQMPRRRSCRGRASAIPEGRHQAASSMNSVRRASPKWLRAEKRSMLTDTTMRDGHQSCSRRACAPMTSSRSPAATRACCRQLCRWNAGAVRPSTSRCASSPKIRGSGSRKIREQGAPNLLLQMLLRGANGVGYTNYPDNVVKHFVRQAAAGGIDLFRVFDCLNWVENMRVSMEAVAEENKICEATICYTGDILNSARPKYDLKYYVDLAGELEKAGAHIIAVKDMAGLLKPASGPAICSRRCERPPTCRSISTRMTRRASRQRRCWPRSKRRRRGRCGNGCAVRQHVAALPGIDRRGAEGTERDPGSIPNGSAGSRSTGRRCATSMRRSKAT